MTDQRHSHLWQLADGTGLHAPIGQLIREDSTGEVCCHLCGEFFTALGSHLRVHGWTASRYREAMGLCRNRPLTAPMLSASISQRQTRRYREDPELQDHFRTGQAMARSGELAAAATAALDDSPSPERRRLQDQALAQGRETVRRRRSTALERLLEDADAPSLDAYLRDAYADGASLDDLADATGMGRERLRTAMEAAGVAIRAPGQTTEAGRRSRAVRSDEAAQRRLGVDDLRTWLREQRDAGATLTELAQAVGHTTHWVRWRLDEDPDSDVRSG